MLEVGLNRLLLLYDSQLVFYKTLLHRHELNILCISEMNSSVIYISKDLIFFQTKRVSNANPDASP
jgi:hypothetical protein